MRAMGREQTRLSPDLLVVWLLVAVVCVEILVTYTRLPTRELYHVSGSGLAGGASRVLVFLNFPAALVAIAILAVVVQPLPRRALKATALLSAALCATVFWPGVVDQADLDARPVNGLAGTGVALALVVTVVAARAGLAPWRGARADGVRLSVAVALLLVALPWLAADLGFFLDGVPLAGWIFQTGAHPRGQTGLPVIAPAVHHGHHHGMDGVLLVLSALVLSRTLGTIRGAKARAAIALYLSLMLAYGLGNTANDLWLEQVVKRGWTAWAIPSVLEPHVSWAWTVIVASAGIVWLPWLRFQNGAGRTSAAR